MNPLPDVPVSHALEEKLVKSKQRVADHGEVFTPNWLVEEMLKLVSDEVERIDARFLEPACGSGNFLIPVLRQKLATVNERFGKSRFEQEQHGLLALMSVYGIELLEDNANECRDNLYQVFEQDLKVVQQSDLSKAAVVVLATNIIQGDAMTMLDSRGHAITFAEWGYLGKGKFQRRDFLFEALTQTSAFTAEDSLFSNLGRHEIFTPSKIYPVMTIGEIANDH